VEYLTVSEESIMEFRDFEHWNWKKRLRGKSKTTNLDLIKLKRSRRRHEIKRINRKNHKPYKSSCFLRDFRLLPPSRRGFCTSGFWVVTQCIGIVYGCFMTAPSGPSLRVK
jgi:hypothetical protein